MPVELLIARERLRPEMAAEYDRVEREIARASATLGCPHPYLALLSEDGREVWWLNVFVSAAERERVAGAYAENRPFATALKALSAAKERFRESLVMTLTTFRPDLSRGQTLQLAGVRFVAVDITRDERSRNAAVFASAGGEQFALATAADRVSAEAIAWQLGPGAMILSAQPRWSFPAGDIRVRVATGEDVVAMALCRLTDPSAGPADTRMGAYFAGQHHPRHALLPRIGFVALAGEVTVGYIAGHLTSRFGYQGEVQYLFVDPVHRRRGVATKLLQQLAAWFREHDATRVCVNVNPDSPSAQPFYERMGAARFKPHWSGWNDITSLLPLVFDSPPGPS